MNQYETGKIYVVWKDNPNAVTLEVGIELLIKRLSVAEYPKDRASCWGTIDEAKEDIRKAAFDYSMERCLPLPDDKVVFSSEEFESSLNPMCTPGSPAYKKAVKEFGQRAVYEVTVRQVGYVDATGKLTPAKKKK